jgi:hypothetical protein
MSEYKVKYKYGQPNFPTVALAVDYLRAAARDGSISIEYYAIVENARGRRRIEAKCHEGRNGRYVTIEK